MPFHISIKTSCHCEKQYPEEAALSLFLKYHKPTMSDYRSAMSRALFVALLLVVPSSAIWPKRGLAWNDGIPIEVC